MPPPSSGGVALIEMMNLMELADLDKIEFNSTSYVHLVAEAMKGHLRIGRSIWAILISIPICLWTG
jgi:gamma-glutamyltranspeptidase